MLDLRMRFNGSFQSLKILRMLRILKQVMDFGLEELSIQFSRIFMRGALALFEVLRTGQLVKKMKLMDPLSGGQRRLL